MKVTSTIARPGRGRESAAHRLRDERGIALIIALMTMMLMMALGTALMLMTTTETHISMNFRNSSEGMYATDAALERAVNDLLTVPDWNQLLSGAVQSAFVDGPPSGARTFPNGTTVDLGQVLSMANCQKLSSCSAGDLTALTNERPWGANNPVWKLYAYGPVNSLLPTGTINSPYYVVVMVGDDPSENDGDPLHDGASPCPAGQTSGCNPGSGVLALRAEAFGPHGAHNVIEMTVARTDTTELERGYTGQRGQDEQNRRARKAAVQTPGRGLTRMEMNLSGGGGLATKP